MDNAGVANDVGVGSYADFCGSPNGAKPTNSSSSFGPTAVEFERILRASRSDLRRFRPEFSAQSKLLELRHGAAQVLHLPHDSNLEFRAEAFNIFNITQFRIYDPTLGNQANNTITCYGDASTGYSAGASSCANSAFLHPVECASPQDAAASIKACFLE